jgi:hypothetical protein
LVAGRRRWDHWLLDDDVDPYGREHESLEFVASLDDVDFSLRVIAR